MKKLLLTLCTCLSIINMSTFAFASGGISPRGVTVDASQGKTYSKGTVYVTAYGNATGTSLSYTGYDLYNTASGYNNSGSITPRRINNRKYEITGSVIVYYGNFYERIDGYDFYLES